MHKPRNPPMIFNILATRKTYCYDFYSDKIRCIAGRIRLGHDWTDMRCFLACSILIVSLSVSAQTSESLNPQLSRTQNEAIDRLGSSLTDLNAWNTKTGNSLDLGIWVAENPKLYQPTLSGKKSFIAANDIVNVLVPNGGIL